MSHLPYSSDNNDELIREAISERNLLDLVEKVSELNSATLDEVRHPTFSKVFKLPGGGHHESYIYEVRSPENFDFETITKAMLNEEPIEITYQTGFRQKVIGDDRTPWNGGFTGYYPTRPNDENKVTPRALLISVSEMLNTEKFTIVEVHKSMTSKRSRDIDKTWSFVGAFETYGGTGYYDRNSISYYKFTVTPGEQTVVEYLKNEQI